MTRRIYITGVMGSGKTSVAQKLAGLFYGSFHKEEVNEFLLNQVFNNKDNEYVNIVSQINFILDFIKAHDYKLMNNTQVFDSSLHTNGFFTECLLGKIPKEVHDMLGFGWDVSESTTDVSYHIFLECSYNKMMERIKLRGRDYEDTDDFDYKKYYNTFSRRIEDTKKLATENYIFISTDTKSVNDVAEEIYKKITELEKSG